MDRDALRSPAGPHVTGFKSNFTERTAWLERRRMVLPARFA